MLNALGLGPLEEASYRWLIRRVTATTEEIAAELGKSSEEVTSALTTLVGMGLARTEITAEGENYTAAAPVALTMLLSRREDELRRAQLAVTALSAEYRDTAAERGLADLIKVVTGADAVRHHFEQVQRAARSQIRTFVTRRPMVVSREANTAEDALASKGVQYRIILERAGLEETGAVEGAIQALSADEEIRVVETLPAKLVIADDDLALVSLPPDPHGEPGAVLMHASGLLQALAALFETTWDRAYPLRLAADGATLTQDTPGTLEPIEASILTLLLAGLTDRSIANQLGLSMRTVQRRVHELMEIAGVQTRIQLGWHAARHGWG